MAGLAGFHPAHSVALFTVGTGDQHGLGPLGRVTGEHSAGTDRLVVRMSMNSHQRQ